MLASMRRSTIAALTSWYCAHAHMQIGKTHTHLRSRLRKFRALAYVHTRPVSIDHTLRRTHLWQKLTYAARDICLLSRVCLPYMCVYGINRREYYCTRARASLYISGMVCAFLYLDSDLLQSKHYAHTHILTHHTSVEMLPFSKTFTLARNVHDCDGDDDNVNDDDHDDDKCISGRRSDFPCSALARRSTTRR